MGTGIGKDCEICKEQLNDDEGYHNEEICLKCYGLIPKVLAYLGNKEINK